MNSLHRRFAIVAALIAALGVMTSILIQETRPDRHLAAPEAGRGLIGQGNRDCPPLRTCRFSTGFASITTG